MIKGEKVNLREIESKDLAKMVEWRNKDRIRKCFFNQELLIPEKQKKWFDEYLKKDDDKIFIIETKDGISVGTIGLKDIDLEEGKAELGRMVIGEDDYLGQGLAKNACLMLINYAFNEMNLKNLCLEVFADNKKAVNLYEKCGFSERIGERFVSINNNRYAIITMTFLGDRI